MKDIALAYAKAGWPVLPVYGMRHVEDEGIWACRCPRYGPDSKECNPNSKSRGKHALYADEPLGAHWRHGAKDATSDVRFLEQHWPGDDFNVAIAGRDCNPIIDIDHPTIVALLLNPEFGLRDQATVSTTGRGLHIYMECAPTKNGLIKLKNGERIGEIRGGNMYVVAPPSMHFSGKNYRWLGESVLVQGPTTHTGDAWSYLGDLLRPLGIELSERRDALGPVVTRTEPIVGTLEIPYSMTNSTLWTAVNQPQMYSRSEDRSGDLYHLACELVRDIRAQKAEVSPYKLAGLLKQVDIARGNHHPKGPKYNFRDNADDHYWSVVQDAYVEVGRTDLPQEPKTEGEAPILKVVDGPPPGYGYYEDPPMFTNNEGRKPVRLANFEPKIIENVVSWTGDDEDDKGVKRLWHLQLRQGEEVLPSMMIEAEKYSDPQKFSIYIRSQVPSHFILDHGQSGPFLQGVQEYSGKVPVRRAFALSGWIPGRDAFLLPGAPGAITPNGFDETTRYESSDVPQRFLQYGWSVTPKEGVDLAEVMRALLNLREPHVIIPILCQVLAAPLKSLGIKDPVVVHLFARTGSYKSTISRIVLSLFGKFTDSQVDKIEEWKSTDSSLQNTMFRSRDLPLLIDDFKMIGLDPRELNKRITLIQNYSDGTGRTRSTTRQTEREHQTARCLVLSTGEDVWEGQESAMARTLVIDASVPDDKEKIDSLKRRMSNLQRMVADGQLGALGYEYIHWLVSRGHTRLIEELGERYAVKRMGIADSVLDRQHPRVSASVAMLLAVSSLFMEFLAERIPDVLEEYRVTAAEGWGRTVLQAAEKAEESKAYSPYYQVVNAIISGLSTSEAYLAQRLRNANAMGVAGADTAGYVDGEAVWLGEQATMGWYNRWRRKQGLDSHVSWSAFRQEAMRDHNATDLKRGVSIFMGVQTRLLRIPLEDFFGKEAWAQRLLDEAENRV